ncbi:MAG: ATP-binding protein [Ginsengibacter sp.]
MIVRFRNLSLTAKLYLLGIIPVMFLIYFSVIIYKEKAQKIELLGNYIEHIQQSQNVAGLVAELTRERRYSYFFILGDTGYNQLLAHRERTDSILDLVKISKDPSFINFPKYTFLNKLDSARVLIDSFKMTTNGIMEYYTDAIFRVNLLASSFPANTFLKPVYRELIAQEKLSEMITYLGIIRTYVFNVLLTQKNAYGVLLGTLRIYKVFSTYETEFLLKAPADAVHNYNERKIGTDYEVTLNYLDKAYRTLNFDSTYTASQFWEVSTKAMINLGQQQQMLWQSANNKIQDLYQHEKDGEKKTIAFIIFAILLVIGFVLYVVNNIHKLLTEINLAASKISVGATGLHLKNMPSGIIGNLAKSIIEIDKNNIELTNATNQIGKGNFEINVRPRSDQDLLGISIKKMRDDLQEFTAQKNRIQLETENLIYRRDEFFSIASHELKTPVTSLKAYTQLLLMDAEGQKNVQNHTMLTRMEMQINKLTSLINDLLDTSKIENGQLAFNKELFILNDLVSEIVSDMQPISLSQKIIFKNNQTASVYGDKERIRQVISNFISNSIKYASKSKEIIIDIKETEDKITCSVQDFGKGISPEEQDKIFERFYRVSGHNLNTFPGLGLGLFICKKVIEQQGGKIGVISEPGKGSTFYFELPFNSGFTTISENINGD